jgi:hypothetical protein
VAALAEVPTLVDDPPEIDTGLWSAEELETVAALCEAADADAARWKLGDYLLSKVPVGRLRGSKTGAHERLVELAAHVDWSVTHLRAVRDTAASWPPETRVAAAPFYVHDRFRDGGAAKAHWRRDVLVGLPRGARGRITEKALAHWREEHGDAHRGSEHRPRQPAAVAERTAADLPAEIVDLLHRANELLEDAGRLRLDGAQESRVRWALDRFVCAISELGEALRGKQGRPAEFGRADDAPR